ncbi:MAG: hypothetical protein GBAus27B_000453 [Mycoplasmataceae bacterium]|nr:MAG: hypothetical protein GBAus27B_000453 [Mycoplasmataceae bacterium]
MTRLSEIHSNSNFNILEPQIINLQITEGKILVFLQDGREIITPIDLLTKWGILDNDVESAQLEEYELRNQGRVIYFPKIDDVLPTRKIIKGLFVC